ncbi:MAG: serine acetyltransferase [Bacteroidales bacterium]|nr:serine acetyltransferase [Bacteroidales bacterium]
MKQILIAILLFCCAATTCSAQQNNSKESMHSLHYKQRVALFDSLPPISHSDIVLLGNSLTEFGGNWNLRLTGKLKGHYVNRGIIGDDAMGMYDRLYQIVPGNPRKIFLLAGVNDVSHGLSADSVVTLVKILVDKIRTELPQTKLYIESLLPINESFHRWRTMEGKTETIVAVNKQLCRMAADRGLVYINLFPSFVIPGTHIMRREFTIDGLHLTPAGYKVWSGILKKY